LTDRVVDDTGLPAGHLPLRLLLSGYSVGQEDVMVAAARSGHQVFQPWTDATGQTLLRGLTPEDAGIAVLRSDDPERPATTTISEVGADGVLGLQVVAP